MGQHQISSAVFQDSTKNYSSKVPSLALLPLFCLCIISQIFFPKKWICKLQSLPLGMWWADAFYPTDQWAPQCKVPLQAQVRCKLCLFLDFFLFARVLTVSKLILTAGGIPSASFSLNIIQASVFLFTRDSPLPFSFSSSLTLIYSAAELEIHSFTFSAMMELATAVVPFGQPP